MYLHGLFHTMLLAVTLSYVKLRYVTLRDVTVIFITGAKTANISCSFWTWMF